MLRLFAGMVLVFTALGGARPALASGCVVTVSSAVSDVWQLANLGEWENRPPALALRSEFEAWSGAPLPLPPDTRMGILTGNDALRALQLLASAGDLSTGHRIPERTILVANGLSVVGSVSGTVGGVIGFLIVLALRLTGVMDLDLPATGAITAVGSGIGYVSGMTQVGRWAEWRMHVHRSAEQERYLALAAALARIPEPSRDRYARLARDVSRFQGGDTTDIVRFEHDLTTDEQGNAMELLVRFGPANATTLGWYAVQGR